MNAQTASTRYTRRTALYAGGSAALGALLAACAPSSPAPETSPTAPASLGGMVTPTGFAEPSPGAAYTPANINHPAINVPVPKMAANANEQSAEGFKATIEYFAASLNYLLVTGSLNYVAELDLGADYMNTLTRFDDESGFAVQLQEWYVSPSATITLNGERPTVHSETSYSWDALQHVDKGPQLVGDNAVIDIPEAERHLEQKLRIEGTYKDKKWSLHVVPLEAPVSSAATAKATASASASVSSSAAAGTSASAS